MNMSKVKNRILIGVAFVILVGVGIAYYFFWEGQHYLTTDNAKVTATLYPVTLASGGKLDRLKVAQGAVVFKDDVLARMDDGSNVKSPVDGQVVKCSVTSGQIVSPTTQIAVIADLSTTYVTANIDETMIRRVREGQKVTVTLDAYPGRSFTGQVASIEQVTDAALKGSVTSLTTSGTYTKVVQQLPVKIELDDTAHLADIIGTNATVKISLR